ncbi:MAG: tRNA (adenosine(37)-N6)-threonylcarbamoyltransferase complex transferase subunit TsaD, partial [Ottowia sp.]
ALKHTGLKQLVVAGGVGANKRLREKLIAMCATRGGRACFPRPALCTDNGAMIAFAGALRLAAGQHDDAVIRAVPRWDMATLPAV